MSLPRLLLALTVAVSGLFALPARAVDLPRQITFQGRLMRADGSPETAPQDLRFALYATSTGGVSLWEESRPGTPVTNGYYSVVLGSSQPLPASVLNGQALYLGVSLAGQSELTPRLPLVSVPYALRADDSNRLEGLGAASFANANHTHTSVPLAENSNLLQGRNAAFFATATHTHASVPLADNSNLLQGRNAASFADATHPHAAATTTTDGFMAATDKVKLNAAPSTYGNGLNLTAGTLSVAFAGSGTANTAARSNHTHASPALSCIYRTATGNIDSNANSQAWCLTTETLMGGGCSDLGGSAPGAGIVFSPTNVTTASGTTPGGPGYACRVPSPPAGSSVPTAYAICCRIQ
ncbi:MAG TPA: hypothetical protein VNA24_23995 [Hyalangium sp.]|nr:hypothetical protein [Hyalangium sp.]